MRIGGIDEAEEERRKILLKEDIVKKKNKEKYEDKLIDIAINKV